MSQESKQTPFHSLISEDWWAVIVGIALILLVCAGVLAKVPW